MPQSLYCENPDPSECSWIKVPDTEEFGCLFSTVCVRHSLWQPGWQSAPTLPSYPRPYIFPALRNGASFSKRKFPMTLSIPSSLRWISIPHLSNNPPIACRLVLGTQSLEDAMAAPSHRETKARDLPADRYRSVEAESLSLRRSLAELARRRCHEPARRARLQARPSGRPAHCPHSGKT